MIHPLRAATRHSITESEPQECGPQTASGMCKQNIKLATSAELLYPAETLKLPEIFCDQISPGALHDAFWILYLFPKNCISSSRIITRLLPRRQAESKVRASDLFNPHHPRFEIWSTSLSRGSNASWLPSKLSLVVCVSLLQGSMLVCRVLVAKVHREQC